MDDDDRTPETEPTPPVGIEDPETDVIEQHLPVDRHSIPADDPYAEPAPAEADPADATEQRFPVQLDDDYPPTA